ncbi:plant cysteine oxidase 2-like [Macadamia integrifolia]|uniref:plant cysteine oxidase 2-like n=1 Tax=Macadamia integrifolia TaxID=60698 RepID=UPI001C4FDD96|nr:plant cysteine oxidase 2-like [Macadamia integrifolia]
MTMEAGLIEKKKRGKVGRVRKAIKKKRCRTKICPSAPIVLQKLFDSCREVFKGPGTVPPPRDVQNLRQILDCMKPEDVGLSRDLLFFKPESVIKGTPRVKYTTIYKCTNFSLCIFFLPRTAVIPLHNHPGMTVFSKLLLGSMHIKAYDWVDPVKFESYSMPSSNMRLARMKANTLFTAPCDTSVLYPTSGGNIHSFMAVTPCAVLDVLGPPYSNEDGRDCTYYKDLPFSVSRSDCSVVESKEGEGCFGWLEEIDMPKDLMMEGVEYLGPQIIDFSSVSVDVDV